VDIRNQFVFLRNHRFFSVYHRISIDLPKQKRREQIRILPAGFKGFFRFTAANRSFFFFLPPNGLVNLASSTYSHTPCSLSHEETARWAAAFAPMLCHAHARRARRSASPVSASADLEHVRARRAGRARWATATASARCTHKRARHARRPRTPAYARVYVARFPVPDSQVHVACLVVA
jgi:hypothetical protein